MRVSLCGAGLGAARLSFFDFAELASTTEFDGFDFGAQGALDAINEPYVPTLDEVEAWAAHIAYCQFTEAEMRNGTAWRILQGG